MKTLNSIVSILVASSVFVTARAQAETQPTRRMKAVINELISLKPKPIETLTAVEARLQPTPADAVQSLLSKQGQVVSDGNISKVREIRIPIAAGAIPARIYTPTIRGSLPILVYFHGGGWVIGDIDVYDTSARALASKVKAIVVSVEYRKGPENKFPAAHDDAFTAYKWVLDNARNLGGDSRKVAVSGESAGGNLAMTVGLAARDAGIQLPRHILAVYPIAGIDMNTKSYLENEKAKPLNKAMMGWFFKNYLNSADDAKDARINLVAANLQGLPPTTIITDEIDPLHTEGQLLAENLKNQGVKVFYKHYVGVTHEFFGMADVLPEAQDAQNFAAANLISSLK